MGPCTGWQSSELSLDIPSPAYHHGSEDAKSIVSNDSCGNNNEMWQTNPLIFCLLWYVFDINWQ